MSFFYSENICWQFFQQQKNGRTYLFKLLKILFKINFLLYSPSCSGFWNAKSFLVSLFVWIEMAHSSWYIVSESIYLWILDSGFRIQCEEGIKCVWKKRNFVACCLSIRHQLLKIPIMVIDPLKIQINFIAT